MTYDEKVDGLDAIIEDLVEWELSAMDYEALQDYYFDAKKEYYYSNPDGLEDMLKYKQEIDKVDGIYSTDKEPLWKTVDRETFREIARKQDNE